MSRASYEQLEEFVRDCRDNWDCDKDSHTCGTLCRACEAEKLLGPKGEEDKEIVYVYFVSGDVTGTSHRWAMSWKCERSTPLDSFEEAHELQRYLADKEKASVVIQNWILLRKEMR